MASFIPSFCGGGAHTKSNDVVQVKRLVGRVCVSVCLDNNC